MDVEARPREQSQTPMNGGTVETFPERIGEVRLEDMPGNRRAATDRVYREPQKGLGFNVITGFFYNLMRAFVLAVVPTILALCFTVAAWVGSVVPGINSARSEVLTRESDFHRTLDGTQPLLAELAALGAPAEQLEVIYFAYADAKPDEARMMADTYLGVLVDQVEQAQQSNPGAGERLPMMLAPVNSTRRRTGVAYQRYLELLHTPRGRIAAGLHLVSSPTTGMALYERVHPRAEQSSTISLSPSQRGSVPDGGR
ncbi:MAG: hypothetical protein ABMB14_07835 [Myxococcota bacterium]